MASKGKRSRKRVKRSQASVCGDKTQYPDAATAHEKRRHYISLGANPDAVKVYECKYCKHFHVGRKFRSDLRQVQNRLSQWK